MTILKGMNVVHYYVSDWARAKEFYNESLGLNLFWALDEAGWAEFGGPEEPRLAINLWQGEGPVPAGGGAVVVFTVDDIDEAVAALRQRGVEVDDPVAIPGMVTLADFYDPDGNRMQMAQSLAQQAQG